MSAGAKIFIVGASNSGTTTLGAALANAAGLNHIDTDDHYWAETDPPYTVKRSESDRVVSIRQIMGDGNWVLTGSVNDWGNVLVENADLIVFLSTDADIRRQRLLEREQVRHGDRIRPGGDMHDNHKAFLAWAMDYDNPDFTGRSRARHERWLAEQSVPVLRLDGGSPVSYLVGRVFEKLQLA